MDLRLQHDLLLLLADVICNVISCW